MQRLRPMPRARFWGPATGPVTGPATGQAAARRDEDGFVQQGLLFLVISVLGGLLLAGMALPFVGGAGLVARAGADSFEDIPAELETPPLPHRSHILAADGSLIATFFDENRDEVPLAAIAPVMQQAMVAIEDTRFYEHGGVDLRGTARAFVNNQSGEGTQGGSTLTQQYVKNVLLETAADDEAVRDAVVRSGPEGYARKLREMRYALALEERLTKEEILERYLNIAYFGAGAYGVESAARRYFSVSSADLTLEQAALLAGLVQAPGAYDPLRNLEVATNRRNTVLARMQQVGAATPEQVAAAVAVPVALAPTPPTNGCEASAYAYFCDYVLNEVRNSPAFGETPDERIGQLLRGGITITTTLQPGRQNGAQAAVDEFVPREDPSQLGAAIAMVEPGTGAIRAMAQNRTYGTQDAPGVTTVNYVADRSYGGSSGFQAGSTFKVYVMAAALKQGIPVGVSINSPAQVSIGNITSCDGVVLRDAWRPKNSGGSGTFDMRTGTALSVNTFYAQLEARTGLCDPRQIASATGVRPASAPGEPLSNVKSFVLGVDSVSPLAVAESYATFAARGLHCKAYAIAGVHDRNGQGLPSPEHPCEQVLDQSVADAVSAVLTGVIDGGISGRTGRVMSIGRPAAGKTGTTNDNYDVWFSGYTPDLAASVWVGDPGRNVDGRIERRNIRNIEVNGRNVSRGYGGLIPGPIWREAMEAAHEGLPERDFVAPPTSVLRGESQGVPRVAGLQLDDAIEAVVDAGFSYRLVREPSDRYASGVATGTSPRGSAFPGDTITITVSNGPPPAPTPTPTPSPPPSETPEPDPAEEPGDDPADTDDGDEDAEAIGEAPGIGAVRAPGRGPGQAGAPGNG